MFESRFAPVVEGEDAARPSGPAPGKRSRTQGLGAATWGYDLPIQYLAGASAVHVPGTDVPRVCQLDAGDAAGDVDVHAVAAAGMRGSAAAMPYGDIIQRAFGHHDISGVDAYVGGAANQASAALGARAYAAGGAVAFADAPDLHTAAHEAAHVVQQRGGVQLAGGVGRSGDDYERHADAVADLVVAGESAEALLDQSPGGGGGGGVQLKGGPKRGKGKKTTRPTTEAGWIEELQEAAGEGAATLWQVLDEGKEAAASAVPRAGAVVLDLLWPPSTGWRATGDVSVTGLAGFNIGIEASVDGTISGGLEVTLMRTGNTVSVSARIAGGVGVSVGAGITELISGSIGATPVSGATAVSMATDLSQLTWSPSILGSLRGGDLKSALAGLMAAGDAFWGATTISMSLVASDSRDASVALGSDPLATVTAEESFGKSLGGEVTVGPQGLVRRATLTLDRAVGLVGEISPNLRDTIADFLSKLGDRSFDPDSAALRDGSNGAGAAGSFGIVLQGTRPRGKKKSTWEAGLTVSGQAAVSVAGTSASAGFQAEVLYPIDRFASLFGSLVAGTADIADLPPINASGSLSVTVQEICRMGLFPGLEFGALLGTDEKLDAITAKLDVSVGVDPAWLKAQAGLVKAVALAKQGKVKEAMKVIGEAVKIAKELVKDLVKSVTLEIALTEDSFADGQSPLYGILPLGAEGEGQVQTSRLLRFDFSPGAPEVSWPQIAGILSDMLE